MTVGPSGNDHESNFLRSFLLDKENTYGLLHLICGKQSEEATANQPPHDCHKLSPVSKQSWIHMRLHSGLLLVPLLILTGRSKHSLQAVPEVVICILHQAGYRRRVIHAVGHSDVGGRAERRDILSTGQLVSIQVPAAQQLSEGCCWCGRVGGGLLSKDDSSYPRLGLLP